MGMYSNKPGATNEFHLARVPTGAAGQLLRLRLFDVGDSNQDPARSQSSIHRTPRVVRSPGAKALGQPAVL